jgi:hypothetical protein
VVGAVVQAVSIGLLHGAAAQTATLIVAALTAAGVYTVPNVTV